LDTSTSKVNLEVKLNGVNEPVFNHDLIRPVIEEVRKNSVHYTVYRNRDDIKKMNSIVLDFGQTTPVSSGRTLENCTIFCIFQCSDFVFRVRDRVSNPFESTL